MTPQEPIAVIGLTCRFPDAPNIDKYWTNLLERVESVRPLNDEDMMNQGIDPSLIRQSGYINAGTLIEHAEKFDYQYFGYSPREAELMDPQQRLFLQESRRLMDHANLTRDDICVGVFASCRQSSYQQLLGPLRPEQITRPDSFQQLMGNDKDYLATRAAYKLNLTGPAMTVQTACSSSLVAVHQACESLRRGECDAALAGGVAISFPQGIGYFAQGGMIFSLDGHCRPFSADGSGIVTGNGLGIVALKRLSDAKADGDTIHAVIKGSAIANDGGQKLGFTAPGKSGQQDTISLALANAGMDASEIGLLEAHGTGTPLGDPIEVQAVAEIYQSLGAQPNTCAIGSVKGNMGHLDTAAGIASLIKTVLAVRHGKLPASLHCTPVNPRIKFDQTPFYPLTDTLNWPDKFSRRVAGVSSFGIGGTNCHMLVTQYEDNSVQSQPQPQILVTSNHQQNNLPAQLSALASTLSDAQLTRQCKSAALRREHLAWRVAVTGKDTDELTQALANADAAQVKSPRRTLWLFSGQGSQYSGMGQDLYQHNDVFRQSLVHCVNLFASQGIPDLDSVMFEPQQAQRLDQTLYTQAALFSWQYAISQMLNHWGITPDLVCGHSIGEFAAATVAGIFELDQAITLVAQRAKLMEQQTAPGGMLALSIPNTALESLLQQHREICIAAYNGPDLVTLSGPSAALNKLRQCLDQQQVSYRQLTVNRAFHSATMSSIETPFHQVCQQVEAKPKQIEMISSLTGKPIADIPDSDYWVQQLRQPVKFYQACQTVAEFSPDQVIEIGPDGSFTRLMKNTGVLEPTCQITDLGGAEVTNIIARLFCLGYDTPLESYYQNQQCGFGELPGLTFSDSPCWPADIHKSTHSNASPLPFLEPIWQLLQSKGKSERWRITSSPLLPLDQQIEISQLQASFMGQGSLQLKTRQQVFELSYQPSVPIHCPSHLASSQPIHDQLEMAELGLVSAILSPGWQAADSLVRDANTWYLLQRGECVAQLELAEIRTRAQQDASPINIWRWQWQEVAQLYQQDLHLSQESRQQSWLILGVNELTQQLAVQARMAGHRVTHVDKWEPLEYDLILDSRLLAPAGELEDWPRRLEHACRQAMDWLDYAKHYPSCQILTLLHEASSLSLCEPKSTYWPLLHLYRVMKNEHPKLAICCLDLHKSQDANGLLSHLSSLASQGPALTLRNNKLYEPVISAVPGQEDHLPLDWSKTGYTLVAGFGAVGRQLALWLADQGCRQLAILVRKELSTEQQNTLFSLERAGVEIQLLFADLTHKDKLSQELNKLELPLLHVFHTAHSGPSRLLEQQDQEEFCRALDTKVMGSLALYQAVAQQPLRLFCLFSSAAGALAMPGAASYVTANSWQDALASQLQKQGVPALSIAWGQLEMVREQDKLAQLQQTSIKPIPCASGFAVLNGLLKQTNTGLIPIKTDAESLAATIDVLPATRSCLRPLLARQLKALRQRPDDQGFSLCGLNSEQRRDKVADYLEQLIRRRLKFASDRLDKKKALTEQGVDSLVFLELVQVINQKFDLQLTPTIGYEYNSIIALSEHICNLLPQDDIDFSKPLSKGQLTVNSDTENRYEPFPLTDLQQAFLVGRNDSLNLGNVACHQYIELELEDLDVSRLERAWNQLVQRHEMMRCVLLAQGHQKILPDVPHYGIKQRDLRDWQPEKREEKLASIRQRMTYQVFKPEQWPLFELTVSQLPSGISRVHLDMDLLVFDIQSFRIIYGELAQLLKQPHTVLPTLTLSFRDYILAEQALQQEASWQNAKQFWLDRLDSIPAAPDLPLRQHPEQLTQPKFRTLDHRLSADAWSKLKRTATKLGLTTSGAMLTAFTQVLASYSKNQEFTLNITYFNRKSVHPQVMDICGDFTSLMLLPVAARQGERFIEAASRTQNDLWQALNHRDFNGIRLMRELGRHRNTGADSVDMPVVFTSMIGMDFDDPASADWDLMSKQVYQVNQTPQVWLDYQAAEYRGALVTRWFIADDIFEPRLIQGLFDAYTGLLEDLAENESSWDTLVPDLRTGADIRLFEQLNQTKAAEPQTLLPQLFQQQTVSTPNKPAILCDNDSWSYQRLAEYSHRLAHYLIDSGVAASAPVAVVMPKHPMAVVAALGIQAAGACYTPVNGEYDNERLSQILSNLAPACILTLGQELALDTKVINLAELEWDNLANTPPSLRQTADELAYIIYTSGTTGLPKGAMLNHSAPINTLRELAGKLALTPSDRTLSLCAFHHDMSIFDLYAMLACGGAVILPQQDKAMQPGHWRDLMVQHKPSIINAVPAFVTMLLDAVEAAPDLVQPPRHIMMGGDWIPLELVKRLHERWPECRLHSIGGPTETAIVSSYYAIQTLDTSWSSVPYGKPLANQTCYLLNSQGQECPVGVAGEICMGGEAMSLGYWQDEKRTSEKYRFHPRSGVPVFHTGDLGRLNPDGNLEILGRVDNQIKINGLRIEPSEIEYQLNQHQGVQEVALVYEGHPNKQLQAFFTTADESLLKTLDTPRPASWQQALAQGHQACDDLPAGFDLDGYSRHFAEMEQLSTWVMLRCLQDAGYFRQSRDKASLTELVADLQVSQGYQKLFQSWLRVLVNDGYLNTQDGLNYQASDMISQAERLESLQEKLAAEAESGENHQKKVWSLYQRCIAQPQKLLSGEFNPLELMFEGGKTDFAESFYRENPVAAHFNKIAGASIKGLMSNKDASQPLRILEFGAGIGSVTHDILANLPGQDFRYDFTDLSHYFLDNARTTFTNWPQLEYSLFDINQDPVLQGLALHSYDLIIGANVLHDAVNLNYTSQMLRTLLKPGGHLMLVEGTLNPRFQLVSLGFVEGLSHYQDERLETCLPLISAPRWQQVLAKAGFSQQTALPAQGNPVEKMNYHIILAENQHQVKAFDEQVIRHWLRQKLPEYMIPLRWHQLQQLPLTKNGKLDRQMLQQACRQEVQDTSQEHEPLVTVNQQILATIWQSVLQQDVASAAANFFTLGGDSLLMTRLSGLLQDRFNATLDLASLLRNPVLKEQAALIDTLLLSSPQQAEIQAYEEGVI